MLDIFIVAACLVLNAFFSAYEMAFVTISKDKLTELGEDYESIFKRIRIFKRRPERTLSVIQIGITLVGAIAAAVGGTGAVEELEPILIQKFNLLPTLAEAISVAAVILPLTYLSVVFGELIPKTFALRYPKKILIFGTKILFLTDKALSPIVSFLELSTGFFLNHLQLKNTDAEVETTQLMIDIGHLPNYHKIFVNNLVSLKGYTVKKTFIPADEIDYINFSDSKDEILEKISQTTHTRYPVIDGDTVVGLLQSKVFREIYSDSKISWESIIRPITVVNIKENILDVFLKMQKKRQHMANVVNNNGEHVGVITLLDILEEIVGDIDEEEDTRALHKLIARRRNIAFTNKR
ncbi:MAG TPA: CNNM domain-containing protein [Bacteriovoracaceae bacterium]|nr:CNNM domain-containing protein [Bacteriovoracaceae bacterium]